MLFLGVLLFSFIIGSNSFADKLEALVIYSWPILFLFTRIRIKLNIYNSVFLLGIVLNIGGLIMYYISTDLFGLISDPIWTNNAELSYRNKRMISFISNPQNFSAISFLSIAVIEKVQYNFIIMVVGFILFLACAILGGTRFALLALIMWLLVRFKFKVVWLLFPIVFCLATLSLNRLSFESLFVANPIFLSWAYFLSIILSSGWGILVSTKLGSLNSIIGELSPESYWLKTWFEIGLIGTIGIVSVMYKEILRYYSRDLLGIYVYFLLSFFLTPTLYGSLSSVIAYLLIRND